MRYTGVWWSWQLARASILQAHRLWQLTRMRNAQQRYGRTIETQAAHECVCLGGKSPPHFPPRLARCASQPGGGNQLLASVEALCQYGSPSSSLNCSQSLSAPTSPVNPSGASSEAAAAAAAAEGAADPAALLDVDRLCESLNPGGSSQLVSCVSRLK